MSWFTISSVAITAFAAGWVIRSAMDRAMDRLVHKLFSTALGQDALQNAVIERFQGREQ